MVIEQPSLQTARRQGPSGRMTPVLTEHLIHLGRISGGGFPVKSVSQSDRLQSSALAAIPDGLATTAVNVSRSETVQAPPRAPTCPALSIMGFAERVSDSDPCSAGATDRAGIAWHYKKYSAEQSPADLETYAAVEDATTAGSRCHHRSGGGRPGKHRQDVCKHFLIFTSGGWLLPPDRITSTAGMRQPCRKGRGRPAH